ncbi:ribosomal maturation YjgA family protein [Marinisporobacter balticus]|uniref:Uncharacterized protein DUF2809 n=1 Tax=Marinisporobacter balticus TaxID=2018667 RepID=A0A4R2KZV5_9FIRM|nr:DUF2809 domain-containing protein [Marinisporobacter balticus]TCO79483.1 uncharacterized protein DUF2809 [Marinisporobacter balticus]
MKKERSRMAYSIFIIIVISLGIASRYFSVYLARWIAKYAGDVLWGLMVFLWVGFSLKDRSTRFVGRIALIFSFFIEITQLYHAPWIDSIRKTFIGGLVLGFGFLWSDLICYTVGIGIGVLVEKIFYMDTKKV